MRSIYYRNEVMKLDEMTGNISRPAIGMKASGNWRVTGATRFNNFGQMVERISLANILDGRIMAWQHKNGKQRWHVEDYDHGTYRIWMSPNHSISREEN